MIRNRELAEELSQDAFIRALERLDQLKEPEKFKPWLLKIAHYKCLDELRKKKSYYEDLHKWEKIPEPDLNPFQQLDVKQKKEVIDNALMQLDDEERSVVILYYLHDLPISEISETLGIGKSNIKTRLFRARKRLQKILKPINELWN